MSRRPDPATVKTPAMPASFDDLRSRDPPYNTWGMWGEDNEHGQLNLITPESVRRGVAAVKHGVAVCLNLPLKEEINPGRGGVEHEILQHGFYADDKVSFNTQCSTQWDGFKHVSYRNYPSKGQFTYHGGLRPEQVADKDNCKFGIHNFAQKPITTRAHLLDIPRWLERTGQPALDCLSTKTPITLAMIQACAQAEDVVFDPGDILIIRSGYTEAILGMSAEQKATYAPTQGAVGVEPSEELFRWVWESGIPAVAGDMFSFEFWPPNFVDGRRCLHEIFLAGWGLPLGELFDLRELGRLCEMYGQYTFLLTTMGMNLEGAVGTPSNAQAIL